jgi:hypothetical protein
MTRKITVGVLCVFFLIALLLFLTSKISDAYATATDRIFSDRTITQEYGTQQYAVLIGSRFQLGPEWSCARLLFALKGTNGSGIVKVLLRRKQMRNAWEVLDISIGYNTEPKISCGSTA